VKKLVRIDLSSAMKRKCIQEVERSFCTNSKKKKINDFINN
jgi:hypothetical protein